MKKYFKLLPVLSFLVGILTTALLAWQSSMLTLSKQELLLQSESEKILTLLQARMDSYKQILLSGGAFIYASDDVSRDEWRIFVERQKISENFPGIQGIGYSQVVRPSELAAHTAKVKADGFPTYTIRPTGQRELYTSIIYLEPFNDRNRRAFGFDMYSEEVRREAMQRAIDTGEPALSKKVRLVQENTINEQSGFLMYVPVYKKGATLNTTEDRMANIVGFVYSPFRANDFISGIMGKEKDDMGFRLYDGEGVDAKRLMVDTHPNCRKPVIKERVASLQMNGHQWTLEFKAHEEFFAPLQNSATELIMLGGTAFSIVLFFLFAQTSMTQEKAERLAQKMTEELSLANRRWEFAVTGAGDGVWDWDLKNNSVRFDKQWKAMLGYKEDEISDSLSEWDARVHPDDKERVYKDINNYIIGATSTYRNEHRIKCKDGSYKWILDRGVIVERDLEGKPLKMIGTHSDVSERKEMEENIESINKYLHSRIEDEVTKRQKDHAALIQSEKMAQLGNMLGAIIHQWKQPLNVISMLAQDVKESFKYNELNEEVIEKNVGEIMSQIRFMDKTAEDFRNFYKPAKIAADFSVKEKTAEILSLLAKELKQNNITVNLVGDKDIFVRGFESEYKQVALNIINNAKDAFIERALTNAKIDVNILKEGDSVIITITDNAGGIPDELLPDKLFEQFISTKGIHGTGIGLSICKSIIEESMSGKLTARNIEGGAQFKAVLPAQK